MLRILDADDPALASLLGNAHQRLQRLIDEADQRSRSFYAETLGEAMGMDEAVARIFRDVQSDGDEAVTRYSRAFDGSTLAANQLVADRDDMQAAWDASPAILREALQVMVENVRAYQERLLPQSFGAGLDEPLGVRWLPLKRVGGYVPGGKGGSLPLCSSVVMNLLPAQVAGVEELVLATPPREDGSVAPEILAAAHAAGVELVYKAGGIQAIAAMACGTASLPAVEKIVGPGNIAVTMAKRHAYGRVDIDMLAGPSEVLVIHDGSVEADWVAADVLSQAEHDTLAVCILVCVGTSGEDVLKAIERRLADLPAERQEVARASIERLGLCVRCPDLARACEVSDAFAPEHLELLVTSPSEAMRRIRNAGAIFVGPWSPEPIGDYIAGPSHTLPTCGTARMWSGIGTDTFMKRQSIINYSESDFRAVAEPAITLAETEGLTAHANALKARLES